ncbi:hypothetical protein D8X55_00805 [Malacoplasma penetrans]|uniref:Integral membrane protein n=1 Tax=Malacoplasma penetrans (strain HF-2) TaxID=272633 RepID=Q8EVX7_MALP2|nr:hypothetical protein [Malacoplasma penetrans]RXY97225.1 hypothetical protein D8X55_00805 [Malacoplasma penetrans]BAC44222.1 putative integral membrane protein [Malacoplasma penetrans HF-2]
MNTNSQVNKVPKDNNLRKEKKQAKKNKTKSTKENKSLDSFDKVLSTFDNFQNKLLKDINSFFKEFFSKKYFVKRYLKFQKFFFVSSIVLLVSMFFCSAFLGAKVGYYINSVHLDQYNSLLIPGSIIGILSFFLFMINSIYQLLIFLKLYVAEKKIKNLRFFAYVGVLSIDLLIILLSLVLIIVDHRLIFITEIILVFYSLICSFLYFDEKYDLDFEFIKKMNNKIISNFNIDKIKETFLLTNNEETKDVIETKELKSKNKKDKKDKKRKKTN